MESKSSQRRPRHILELTRDEKLNFVNSFDRVFSDIDGVVWNVMSRIDGAGEGFTALQKAGKKCIFLTNNSVRPDSDYIKKFKDNGIETDMKDLIHPAKSVVDYLKKINFDGLIYCVATRKFKDHLRQNGYNVIDGPNKILEESFTDLAMHVFDKEAVKAVIIDVDFNLSAPKLIRAHQYLRRDPNCLLIAGATDMLLPIRDGLNIIGPGPYIKVVAEASEKNAITLGKPGRELGEMIIERFNITDPTRTLMIGDMLEQDIGFGKKMGFQSLVVLTGGCKKEHLTTHKNPNEIPDYYADSMRDFVKFFESLE